MSTPRRSTCAACGDSGTAYWCDDVWGSCMECCCIDCGEFYKNCECVRPPPPPPVRCTPCRGTGRVAGAICTVCCCNECGKVDEDLNIDKYSGDVFFDTKDVVCGLCECETRS